ncbi:hypothetical protein A8950_0093 [Dongia mobilis]|uniref:PilZ domain-containing protein n=1 Tax=Dongia mobilis TaxID=578943 RepID=A0A4R6X2T2_9PROT|nr:hypothetical protein [Dongia mobilis]TDQ86402.1 hypothetical protein A8950_0093 [Dongia mobilis]
MQAQMAAQNAPASPRFTLRNMHVMVDGKPHPIVNMNIQEVLIGGLPDWMAAGQRLEFSFVITLKDWERSLPTYGVVIKNDSAGLDVRYTPPLPSWRNILMKLLTEDSRGQK